MDQEKEKKQKKEKFVVLNRVTTVDKIFFAQNIEVLIRAGFSLSNALKTVADQTKQKRLREIISALSEDVEAGQTFADALRKFDRTFDSLFVNMIESGEIAGKLEVTLKALTNQLKKSHTMILKVRNALAYPVVILIAMLGIGTAMMIFVIPKIVDLYRDTSYELPLVTRIIIIISDFVLNNGLLTLGIILVTIIILSFLIRQPNIKLLIHRFILHLPIAGKIIQEYNLARFCRVFHSLISTDLPIVQTFDIITNILGNRAYRVYLQNVIPQLEKGISIGDALADDELLFPPTAVKIIAVGETSGSLEEMTNEVAEHFEQEVSSALDGLAVLIEPVLMLCLGLGVGIIAVAILWPMYNLVNVI